MWKCLFIASFSYSLPLMPSHYFYLYCLFILLSPPPLYLHTISISIASFSYTFPFSLLTISIYWFSISSENICGYIYRFWRDENMFVPIWIRPEIAVANMYRPNRYRFSDTDRERVYIIHHIYITFYNYYCSNSCIESICISCGVNVWLSISSGFLISLVLSSLLALRLPSLFFILLLFLLKYRSHTKTTMNEKYKFRWVRETWDRRKKRQ